MNLFVIITSIILLTACEKNERPTTLTAWQNVCGRDENAAGEKIVRKPTYRLKVPREWLRTDPETTSTVVDTKLPLCEFTIRENDETIRITIHNFPSQNMDDRVPPNAQIARWKRQFTKIEPTSLTITPQAFSGFSGLLLDASGIINDKETTMLSWSLQLAPELYRRLNLESDPHQQQMRGDITIKAQGDKKIMEKYREEIISAARSFELIQPIAYRS